MICSDSATGRRYWFHLWSAWQEPQRVTNSSGAPEVAQRRHCIRCNAVDYRRVIIHN